MILTDYLTTKVDLTWQYASQTGIDKAVIRLPEDGRFDYTDPTHWEHLVKRYTDYGFTPLVVEPMPNELHDPVKEGAPGRDAALERMGKMMRCMALFGIHTLCFNFMAHVGWTRTTSSYPERGGARTTGFRLMDYHQKDTFQISEQAMWDNYRYFLDAIIPRAQQYGIRLALHPDDPPLAKLGGVSRIMTSLANIDRAVHMVESDCLGVTFCSANFAAMGEDLDTAVRMLKDKIFFIHFRDIAGTKEEFHETFHDNGRTDMAKLLRLYRDCKIDVPIRVDHVPTMAGEEPDTPGYGAVGRLFAIGYLKGLLEMMES